MTEEYVNHALDRWVNDRAEVYVNALKDAITIGVAYDGLPDYAWSKMDGLMPDGCQVCGRKAQDHWDSEFMEYHAWEGKA